MRKSYFDPRVIYSEVQRHLEKLTDEDKPDYLTFVANGEPTLDQNLGESIERLKQFNIPIAVITNASLLKYESVRKDLYQADWVSLKVDANNDTIWEAMNWPMSWLNFEEHIHGMLQFAASYRGKLATETMLVEGVNDSPEIMEQTSKLVAEINPGTAYISIPTRPPAISSVEAPDEPVIIEAFQIFSEKGINTELILGFEGTNTGYTGNAIEDIINICTVHPMREDTLQELLRKNCADHTIIDILVKGNYIKRVLYQSEIFYIRQFHN